MKDLRKPKIGVLLLSTPRFHDLGEGTEHGYFYERKEQAAADLLANFDFAETIFPGIVYTREDMAAAMKAFSSHSLDMIFVLFLSWSDDFAWVRFLRDTPTIPLLFATLIPEKPGFEDSFTDDRFVSFLAAGGLVGTLEASGSLSRIDRNQFHTVIGSLDKLIHETHLFARAAAVKTELFHTAFGLLPSYNEVMWSTYVDPYNFFMKAGPELRFLSVAELEGAISTISKERTLDAMNSILAAYSHDPKIQTDKMSASVSASLAIEDLSRKAGIELLVLNDVDPTLLRRIGLRPGFSPCPGTHDIMVVPEGDLGGGLACYILQKLSGKHVNFIEPFYIDKRNGTFAAGHAGPQDYTDPNGKTIIALDTRFAKSDYKYAGAPFAWHLIGPGLKTLVHVSENNGTFKMAAALVEGLECRHFLAGYSHGILKPQTDTEDFFRQLIEFGVTQHYALADGDYRKELKLLASIMNFKYLEIPKG